MYIAESSDYIENKHWSDLHFRNAKFSFCILIFVKLLLKFIDLYMKNEESSKREIGTYTRKKDLKNQMYQKE